MTKIQNILLISIIMIFIQCHSTNSDSKITGKTQSESSINHKKNVILKGISNYENNSYKTIWNIHLFDNDSIIMLSSLKINDKDIRLNNRQYFGRLTKSDKYSYEIKISKYFEIIGCIKPINRYLETDTIPFYIDSTLQNSVGFWKLKIDTNKDTVIINHTNFLYKTNIKDYNSEIKMSIIPNEKSGLFPVTIKNGLRCGVYLSNKMNSNKYYLNIINGKYELIIDRTVSYGGQKDCDNCIKKVMLSFN